MSEPARAWEAPRTTREPSNASEIAATPRRREWDVMVRGAILIPTPFRPPMRDPDGSLRRAARSGRLTPWRRLQRPLQGRIGNLAKMNERLGAKWAGRNQVRRWDVARAVAEGREQGDADTNRPTPSPSGGVGGSNHHRPPDAPGSPSPR